MSEVQLEVSSHLAMLSEASSCLFLLGYDKLSTGFLGTYAVPQLNRNINGTAWKSTCDNEIRMYDFEYPKYAFQPDEKLERGAIIKT